MSNLSKIDRLLKNQTGVTTESESQGLLLYAEYVAEIENVTVVVSDLMNGVSRIYPGKFGEILGIGNDSEGNSIWEKTILELMPEDEREEKISRRIAFLQLSASYSAESTT